MPPGPSPSPRNLFILAAAALAVLIYTAELPRALTVFGVWRQTAKTPVADPRDLRVIPGTVHCEDLHRHEPSNLLFTACEGTERTRQSWFPALGLLGDPTTGAKGRGRIEVIDPRTMKAKPLAFTNFDGPFITHGIDLLDDPGGAGRAVYIFAVNHVPGPASAHDTNTKAPKARSVIEVFRHTLGADTVDHVRSVRHPLITTPNDIFALSPTSFFVTNDHFYREGPLRELETLCYGAKWSNVVHVEFGAPADGSSRDDDHAVGASIALDGLHYANGLGHGRTPSEMLVVGCASGRVHVGEVSSPAVEDDGAAAPPSVTVKDTLEFDSTLDNPSWFRDPYAAPPGRNLSGLVAAGLTRGIDLAKAVESGPPAPIGVMVWMATPRTHAPGPGEAPRWDTRLLFEDDSSRIRSASAAVLVAIDPAEEQGERKAWLFVSGFLSTSIIAVKVTL